MDYYLAAFKKYAVFTGRANRAEYWYFVLFNFIAYIVISIVSALIDDKYNALRSLYSLIVLLPSIGVAIRRMHDINKSGWWILIGLIPLIGWIWAIVLYATKSDNGSNDYGPASTPETATVPPAAPQAPTFDVQ